MNLEEYLIFMKFGLMEKNKIPFRSGNQTCNDSTTWMKQQVIIRGILCMVGAGDYFWEEIALQGPTME